VTGRGGTGILVAVPSGWTDRLMTRDVVRAGYDEIGEHYHSWSHEGEVRLGFVQRVLDRLPAGSTVVDLGSAGMTVEDAQVVGEDEGEGRTVEFLWVTAVQRG
jgi:hypothetical protein